MSGWELVLKCTPEFEVDGSSLTALATLSDARGAAMIQLVGTRPERSVDLADLFRIHRIEGDEVVMVGDLSFIHRIGHRWETGNLRIDGEVGAALGIEMRGGRIELRGNAKDGVATQMRGGHIGIVGNVGNFVAGPLSGRRSGMSGGQVMISGDAGDHLGHRMRRGSIVVKGSCHDGLGSELVAGTIVVGGDVGSGVGMGMRRGTLILRQPVALHETRFTPPRKVCLSIARLLADQLSAELPSIAELLSGTFNRSLGDRTVGGQGEVWYL